ncbi:MAG: hypothetical protein A3H72_02695 [Candidatus Doudnabacteria bacterium RIFCSPLOWO2_02_FULL_48_8]|uniref:Uncharacterized protein n=1 Tax=Candidatus Doudnabacteria bacterium RIFCSPHIGHO2_01_FULL_46_24 TaxID=1817825 RepID=A0A1F5NVA5_9BACT|nr:MAG: hypothetical protein A2720_03060 [Candidatus Doudnabacteria bacterium RIFCSPHIGHO2_01_FULL_46_24]OGE95085.1 MAG: hypothetical protein A3H72_02695 [Candidatus Doudnabacteria bacterium RIFCSPLOWO2_02_FULL_48_8]OGE95761.1 MAG: hypothetical protein A3E98_02830 [Candidatus Doudnabacteria bacterium RIFCSPHIGHO2_12_FULL_48_11]
MEEAWKASEQLAIALDLAALGQLIPEKGLIVLEQYKEVYDPGQTARARVVGKCPLTNQPIVLLTRRI